MTKNAFRHPAATGTRPAEIAHAETRIVGARAHVLRAKASDGIAMSFGRLQERTTILVEVETGDGRVGYGESWANFPPWIEHERVATLRDGVFPIIIGADAGDIAKLHHVLVDRLSPFARQWGAPGPIMQAISAVDTAMWDLAGKAAGQSVSALEGRVRDSTAVYASSVGPEDVFDQATRCRLGGHRAIKVRLGFGATQDEEILEAARAGCGASVELYGDANQAWTLDQALAMAPTLQKFGVVWVEEPIRDNRLADLEQFHVRSGIDVATGENVYGLTAFSEYCQSSAIKVIQPDVTKVGGMTSAFEICRMAADAGKSVIPHLYGGAFGLAATLQLAGAAAAVAAIEYDVRDNPLRDPLWPGGPLQQQGRIAIPSGPGLGIVPDQRVIASLTQNRKELHE